MEISDLNEADYRKAIACVDKARAARLSMMQQESSKMQSLAAGLLLSFALENDLQSMSANHVSMVQVLAALAEKENLQIRQQTIERTEHGKPYFADCPQIHFNLSHSGDYVICGMGDSELGVDIQSRQKPMRESTPRRLFCAQEMKCFSDLPNEEKKIFLFDVWAVKEAFVKWCGEGLSKDFRELCVDFEACKVLDLQSDECCDFVLYQDIPGYSVAVCMEDMVKYR